MSGRRCLDPQASTPACGWGSKPRPSLYLCSHVPPSTGPPLPWAQTPCPSIINGQGDRRPLHPSRMLPPFSRPNGSGHRYGCTVGPPDRRMTWQRGSADAVCMAVSVPNKNSGPSGSWRRFCPCRGYSPRTRHCALRMRTPWCPAPPAGPRRAHTHPRGSALWPRDATMIRGSFFCVTAIQGGRV